MANADFWRSLKNEFRRLAEYEYRAVPDPADSRRLTAYGDYTDVSRAEGGWVLSDGVTSDFRLSFEEAATRAASALKPRGGANPLQFWLHSLAQFLSDHESGHPDRGHLGVWDQRGGVIRDVPAASAIYCSNLAKEYASGKVAVNSNPDDAAPIKQPIYRVFRRAKSNAAFEEVRRRAQQMIAAGASQREVCQRLADAPRPARAAWSHLPWDKAYRDQQFRPSVCKWLSRNCRG